MVSDAARARLEALNRGPLPPGREPAAPVEVEPAVEVASAQALPAPRELKPLRAASGRIAGEIVGNASGEHLRICTPLETFWKQADDSVASGRQRLSAWIASQPFLSAELRSLNEHFPGATLFLDLETCGFAGSAIFLIGLLRQTSEGLIVEQFLARDYAEERAILESLWAVAAENRVLATFNGKSFDWPMVHDRSTLHRFGQSERTELAHIDLLHHARRRWRRRLPNCKLQTLERHLCDRHRTDDIPGSRIPDAYHHYVRTGEEHELETILRHNALDLLTLLQITLKLPSD